MERPGFNPQALAHSLGRQRLGANKEKNGAQRVRGRRDAGGHGSER
jgi:hypothetical protein